MIHTTPPGEPNRAALASQKIAAVVTSRTDFFGPVIVSLIGVNVPVVLVAPECFREISTSPDLALAVFDGPVEPAWQGVSIQLIHSEGDPLPAGREPLFCADTQESVFTALAKRMQPLTTGARRFIRVAAQPGASIQLGRGLECLPLADISVAGFSCHGSLIAAANVKFSDGVLCIGDQCLETPFFFLGCRQQGAESRSAFLFEIPMDDRHATFIASFVSGCFQKDMLSCLGV